MMDGTTVRLPFMKNASLDESALELVSRKVDVPVDRALGESYAGRDSQLDAAVRELLAQIDKAGKPQKPDRITGSTNSYFWQSCYPV